MMKKGIIYKITCNITNENYIGSTFDTLKERFRKHILDCKLNHKPCASRHIIKRGDYEISILEEYYTDDRIELEKREQYYMDNIQNINVKRAYTSQEKRGELKKNIWNNWYEKNKEQQREKAKDYYYINYEEVRKGDRRRKDWRRSWKPDGRTGFFNSMLDININVFSK